MFRMKRIKEAMRLARQRTNNKAMATAAGNSNKELRKSPMMRSEASRTLIPARAMAARTMRARRARIVSSASSRGASARLSRISRARCRERSMTRPKRLVMLSSSRPIPEIRMTGPMESCKVGMRSARVMRMKSREDEQDESNVLAHPLFRSIHL